jgi:hypothetical protein
VRRPALVSIASTFVVRAAADGLRYYLCREAIAYGARIRSDARRLIAVYLRFVVAYIDRDSGRELGVFQAVWNLRDRGRLSGDEETHHDSIRKWFNEHLEKPTRFTAAKPPYYRRQAKALSWFKDSAHEHISRVRELVTILEHHGISVRMLKTDRVGYIVYEDEYQIVAEPFAKETY